MSELDTRPPPPPRTEEPFRPLSGQTVLGNAACPHQEIIYPTAKQHFSRSLESPPLLSVSAGPRGRRQCRSQPDAGPLGRPQNAAGTGTSTSAPASLSLARHAGRRHTKGKPTGLVTVVSADSAAPEAGPLSAQYFSEKQQTQPRPVSPAPRGQCEGRPCGAQSRRPGNTTLGG